MEEIKKNCLAIKTVPLSKDFILEALKVNPLIYEYIPEEFIDDDVKLAAIKAASYLLPHITLPTREMYEEALKRDGRLLEIIPHTLKDRELCSIAIKQNGLALAHVPDELKDKELCVEAANNGCRIRHIPRIFMDKSLYLIAVTQDWFYLNQVPEEFIDDEIREAANKTK